MGVTKKYIFNDMLHAFSDENSWKKADLSKQRLFTRTEIKNIVSVVQLACKLNPSLKERTALSFFINIINPNLWKVLNNSTENITKSNLVKTLNRLMKKDV